MAKKSQILILSLIAAMLFATPFLSGSVRSVYHYFIINILIVALGAEAGLLSSSSLKPAPDAEKTGPVSTPSDHNKPRIPAATSNSRHGLKTSSDNGGCSTMNNEMQKLASVSPSGASSDCYYLRRKSASSQEDSTTSGLEINSVQKSSVSKVSEVIKKLATGKICINGTAIKTCQAIKKLKISSPSIFFIESEEAIHEEEGQLEEEVLGDISGQELFAKAEAFIGNFYQQLKMQRQESWNTIQNALQQ